MSFYMGNFKVGINLGDFIIIKLNNIQMVFILKIQGAKEGMERGNNEHIPLISFCLQNGFGS